MPTNFLGLSSIECERSIYRIISFERLCEFFESQKYTFIHPTQWDDPFENYLSSAEYLKSGEKVEVPGRKGVYGSCWTQRAASDAMWRIYSPDKKSVRIKTTPSLMKQALDIELTKREMAEAFIGKVQYLKEREILGKASDHAINLYRRRTAQALAESFLYKRNPFSHEAEVRLLYADISDRMRTGGLLKIPMNPHDIIQTVLVDPRAPDGTVQEYKAKLKSAFGFKKHITRSTIYNKPKPLVIDLDDKAA